jgi:hypothetical protein
MKALLVIIFLLIGPAFSGCAETRSHNAVPSPVVVVQAGRYIETEGLGQLPNRRLAITSFGIEYDTKLLVLSTKDQLRRPPGEIPTLPHVHKQIFLDLNQDRMQSLADQAYVQLVTDLEAAGYDVIPHNMFRELPAYRSLIDLGGHESPTSITFRLGDPENLVHGEGWVFAPNGLRWYSPSMEEVGSRVGNTLKSLGSDIRLTRLGLLGGEAVSQAEVDLANDLNATLVKAYYVVSPVRSVVENELLAGPLPVEGNTIIGHGETRLAFRTPDAPTNRHLVGTYAPPRDGNAFVRLQRDVRIDGDLTYGQALESHLEVIGKLFILAMMAER